LRLVPFTSLLGSFRESTHGRSCWIHLFFSIHIFFSVYNSIPNRLYFPLFSFLQQEIDPHHRTYAQLRCHKPRKCLRLPRPRKQPLPGRKLASIKQKNIPDHRLARRNMMSTSPQILIGNATSRLHQAPSSQVRTTLPKGCDRMISLRKSLQTTELPYRGILFLLYLTRKDQPHQLLPRRSWISHVRTSQPSTAPFFKPMSFFFCVYVACRLPEETASAATKHTFP